MRLLAERVGLFESHPLRHFASLGPVAGQSMRTEHPGFAVVAESFQNRRIDDDLGGTDQNVDVVQVVLGLAQDHRQAIVGPEHDGGIGEGAGIVVGDPFEERGHELGMDELKITKAEQVTFHLGLDALPGVGDLKAVAVLFSAGAHLVSLLRERIKEFAPLRPDRMLGIAHQLLAFGDGGGGTRGIAQHFFRFNRHSIPHGF